MVGRRDGHDSWHHFEFIKCSFMNVRCFIEMSKWIMYISESS